MKILMTGSTGLVGKALIAALAASGRPVTPLVRRRGSAPGDVSWDGLDSASLAGSEAVIHLAGESIASGRWTAAKKQRIVASRVQGTGLLAQAISRLQPPPRLLLCASAIGYYGNRGQEVLTEDSSPGSGFVAETCRQWEQAAAPAAAAGIRVVHMRLGIVLSKSGGALAKMLTPFRFGLGGVIGGGEQFVSWIALEDVVGAMIHLLDCAAISGPVNLVAPQSVTNRQFTKALGRALHRPTIVPMPAVLARLAMGEMADELLLASARVVPKRLQEAGFGFKYPDLDGALAHELG
jgi:uncharacterized protein